MQDRPNARTRDVDATTGGVRPLLTVEATLAALAFVGVALAWTAYVHKTGREIADSGVYERYAERVLAGELPYRDFSLEYPPLALVPALPTALLTRTHDQFYVVYAGLLALTGAVGVLLVARTLVVLGRPVRQRRVALAALAASPLAFGSVALSRFDLAAATLTALAVLLVVTGRLRPAALVLGLATATKLYPVLLLPLVVSWAWRRSGPRAALATGGAGVGAALAVYLPFLLLAPGGVADSFRYNLDRPLQMESLGAAALVAAHQLAGLELDVSVGYGSANLANAGPTAAVLSALLGASLAAVWAAFARGEPGAERFVRFGAIALVATVAFSKVGSPQFLLWLLFPLALQRGRRGAAAAACYATAAVATAAYFPWRYRSYLRLDDAWGAALVLLHGLGLVAVLVVLAWPLPDDRDGARRLRPSRAARRR